MLHTAAACVAQTLEPASLPESVAASLPASVPESRGVAESAPVASSWDASVGLASTAAASCALLAHTQSVKPELSLLHD
jgi:hypothetical protein